jgi:hypothetical protein
VEAYYGAYPARRFYDPLFMCTHPDRCGDAVQLRLTLDRYRRAQELRERPAQSEQPGLGPSYGPWGPQRYTPPATPEANIQPAYRGASQLRPQFEQTIQPIDEPAAK